VGQVRREKTSRALPKSLELKMDTANLNWKAISYGFVSFFLLWVGYSVVVNVIYGGDKSNEAVFYTVTIISGMLPGYIASSLSSNFLLHSMIAGVVTSAFLLLFWVLVGVINQGSLYSIVAAPVLLVVLSLLGGLIAKLQGKAK